MTVGNRADSEAINLMREPFQLVPEYREYVWGGNRLWPGTKTAEAWIIYERDRVAAGQLRGTTLAELAGRFGELLLGTRVVQKTGSRFPLLVKLLDCADWLSLQVHPNDEQAERLEGPGQFGKTEAWYIVDAVPGARLIAGIKPGTGTGTLHDAIRSGQVVDHVLYHNVDAGDALFMPAGTVHALGPGLLIYEVQQTSDITYRVYDWDRPASAGRVLHVEQSLQVTDPDAGGQMIHPPDLQPDPVTLVRSRFFSLFLIRSGSPIWLDPARESFHALTVVEGNATIKTAGQELEMSRFESVVVPAASDPYQVLPSPGARILLATGGEV